jgi:hypothetical protein
MQLKPLFWDGRQYTLSIERHWQTLFLRATVFRTKKPRMESLLPEGAGLHITWTYDLCNGAVAYFDHSNNWFTYSRLLCDQYCEFYVMERSPPGNTFAQFHNEYQNYQFAVQNLAKASEGYIGPAEWNFAALSNGT